MRLKSFERKIMIKDQLKQYSKTYKRFFKNHKDLFKQNLKSKYINIYY